MRFILILLLALSLNGCSWFVKHQQPVKVVTVVKTIKPIDPPLPQKLSLPWSNDKWIVLTPDIMKAYIKKYDNGNADPLIVYALKVKDYELLAENIAKIKKLVKDQKAIIVYYRSQTDTNSNKIK